MCNGTTKAKQKRSTENAQPHVGCTNKPGDERGEWSAIETSVLGLYAHEGKPTTPTGRRSSGHLSGAVPSLVHQRLRFSVLLQKCSCFIGNNKLLSIGHRKVKSSHGWVGSQARFPMGLPPSYTKGSRVKKVGGGEGGGNPQRLEAVAC